MKGYCLKLTNYINADTEFLINVTHCFRSNFKREKHCHLPNYKFSMPCRLFGEIIKYENVQQIQATIKFHMRIREQ